MHRLLLLVNKTLKLKEILDRKNESVSHIPLTLCVLFGIEILPETLLESK